MWYVTCYTWHLTGGWRWTFSQNVSSLSFTVWKWRFVEGIFTMDHWLRVSTYKGHSDVCPPKMLLTLRQIVRFVHASWKIHVFSPYIYIGWHLFILLRCTFGVFSAISCAKLSKLKFCPHKNNNIWNVWIILKEGWYSFTAIYIEWQLTKFHNVAWLYAFIRRVQPPLLLSTPPLSPKVAKKMAARHNGLYYLEDPAKPGAALTALRPLHPEYCTPYHGGWDKF